jgi:GTP-binding protein HflX
MQVELAQLQYLMPRLVGKGILLSRLGGGIGTRGPGEQKLEVDRRRIRKRIDRLREDLRSVSLHRKTLRKKRKENATPAVALVGYTNAGKSTLLNALTSAGQVVKEGLFTTLDPLSKSLQLPNGEHIVISDTVGFLHELPHNLVEAFKATLEEVVEADLLIHVLDISNPMMRQHSKAVFDVLRQLKVSEKPVITALNKIDLLADPLKKEEASLDFVNSVLISAKLNMNLDTLLQKIQENFQTRMTEAELIIPHSRMDLVDFFYREADVKEIEYLQRGIRIKLNISKILLHKILSYNDIKEID